MRVVALALTVTTASCLFQGISTSERLRETVLSLDEESRWDRLGAAAERVEPRYRRRFAESRRLWGSTIQIADSDVKSIQLTKNEEGAVSVVAIDWYSLDTMQLRQTILRQKWRRHGGQFALSDEAIVAGDEALLVRKRAR